MKNGTLRRLLFLFLGVMIVIAGAVPVLESRDPLVWRRFKRHGSAAIRWRSVDLLRQAFNPPSVRRVAAIVDYDRSPYLFLHQKVGERTTHVLSANMDILYGSGRGQSETAKGDVEWQVYAGPGDYVFMIQDDGALTKCVRARWNPSADLDLGRLDLVYGDLDGDDFISAEEAVQAESFVGKALPFDGQIVKASHADIDRDGKVEVWEAETIRKNVGKRGDARQHDLLPYDWIRRTMRRSVR